MPDYKARDPINPPINPLAPDYRAYASNLHERAEQARFQESKETLDRLARWYEVLARYVDRRRRPLTPRGGSR